MKCFYFNTYLWGKNVPLFNNELFKDILGNLPRATLKRMNTQLFNLFFLFACRKSLSSSPILPPKAKLLFSEAGALLMPAPSKFTHFSQSYSPNHSLWFYTAWPPKFSRTFVHLPLQQRTNANIYSSPIQQTGNKAKERGTKNTPLKCQGFNRKHADTSRYPKASSLHR